MTWTQRIMTEHPHYLIVDDDSVFCQALERALRRRNIACASANDLSSAKRLTESTNPAFSHAVVDLNLGSDSGLSLIPELLDINDQMKIVMLTGYSSIATTVEAIKLGATNYLCKPASADEIIHAFESSPSGKVDFAPPSVERLEWEHIQRVLKDHDGNISATARSLGMHRRTLQRKLQKKPVSK